VTNGRTENPWVAATRFLNKNELPTSYADQVVDFIHKNTAGVEIGTGNESGAYVDPFTGGSRYTGASGGGASMGGSDPFTGELRFTLVISELIRGLRWICIFQYTCTSSFQTKGDFTRQDISLLQDDEYSSCQNQDIPVE
jgi:hypothetical protein